MSEQKLNTSSLIQTVYTTPATFYCIIGTQYNHLSIAFPHGHSEMHYHQTLELDLIILLCRLVRWERKFSFWIYGIPFPMVIKALGQYQCTFPFQFSIYFFMDNETVRSTDLHRIHGLFWF